MKKNSRLSARERQIMDLIYMLGEGTASDIIERLTDAPSRSAVRTFLRILADKGLLKHRTRGREYVYRPTSPRSAAGRSAVAHVVATFFGGSLERAVAMYLANPAAEISQEELARLETLIREAREKGD